MAAMDDLLKQGMHMQEPPPQGGASLSGMDQLLQRQAQQPQPQPAAMPRTLPEVPRHGSGLVAGMHGIANGFNDYAAQFGEGLLGANNYVANKMRSAVGVPPSDDLVGSIQAVRDKIPRLDDTGLAGGVGRLTGTVAGSAVPSSLALKGVNMLSSLFKVGSYAEETLKAISTLGAQAPLRSQLSKELLAKANAPGAAPLQPGAYEALKKGVTGPMERAGQAAAGGAVAGAAAEPGDPARGAMIGAAVGPIPMAAGAAKRGIGNVYNTLMALADKNPQAAADLAKRAMYGEMTRDGGNRLAEVALRMEKSRGDIGRGAATAQRANDQTVSLMDRYLRTKNVDGYAADVATQAETAAKQLSRKLESGGAGLEHAQKALDKRMGPLQDKMAQFDDPVDMRNVEAVYKRFLQQNDMRPTATGPVDSLMALARKGEETLPESIPLSSAYNLRASGNDVMRGLYSTAPNTSPGAAKLSGKAVSGLLQVNRAIREAMHAVPGEAGDTIRMADDVMEKLGGNVQQNQTMRTLFEKARSGRQQAGGTMELNASGLARGIQNLKDKNKEAWKALSDDQRSQLGQIVTELRRNSRAPTLGQLPGSNTAQNVRNTVLDPRAATALDDIGRIPFGFGMPGMVAKYARDKLGEQAGRTESAMARIMKDPAEFENFLQWAIKQQNSGGLPGPTIQGVLKNHAPGSAELAGYRRGSLAAGAGQVGNTR